MTLGTHALVGASVASLVPGSPLLAFVLGFASHFILDAIPHWDYRLLSLEKKGISKFDVDMVLNKAFVLDMLRIGVDASIGIAIALMAFRDAEAFPFVILIGAVAAMLPDALQFVYFKWKREPLLSLQRFHMFMHADGKVHEPVRGIVYQIMVVVVALSLASLVRAFAGF